MATSSSGAGVAAHTMRPREMHTNSLVVGMVPLAFALGWLLIAHLPHSPLWITVVRVLPAGLILLALRPASPTGIWWHRSIILGMVNFSGFFSLQALAVHHIPVGVAATIAAAQTLLIPLGAVIVVNSPLRISHILYATIGILGVALLLFRSDGPLHITGVFAAAGTAVCNAAGLLLTLRWGRPDGIHHLTTTGWQLAAGGLLLLPLALLTEGLVPPVSGTDLPIIVVLVATTAAAFAALFGALHSGWPTSTISRLMLLSPLAVTATAWLLYRQPLAPLQILGATLVIVPVVAACAPPRMARQHPTSPSARNCRST